MPCNKKAISRQHRCHACRSANLYPTCIGMKYCCTHAGSGRQLLQNSLESLMTVDWVKSDNYIIKLHMVCFVARGFLLSRVAHRIYLLLIIKINSKLKKKKEFLQLLHLFTADPSCPLHVAEIMG